MAIPNNQLETWSHQGSITQSSTTYNTIKTALETDSAPYSAKSYEVFLQGSYGNATNIYSESDVDVVIRLKECFHHDLSALPDPQKNAFKTSHSDATYTHVDFQRDVLSVLQAKYGADVVVGDKAIAIAGSGSRRKADVIAAVNYRRYHKFTSNTDQSYDEGICFYTRAGVRIANYPKQHRENLTKKHQATSMWLKPMVRVLKNVRGRLVDEGMIEAGLAPSYYLEGLLYNVPDDAFGGTYSDSFIASINWLHSCDRSRLVCANEQYYLLRDGSPVTWRDEKCEQFLAAVAELWTQW